MQIDRGERRAQKARNKDKRRRQILETWGSTTGDAVWLERTVNAMAAHGKLCSCLMCGNRRKSEGPTIQERRADSATAGQS